MKLTFESIEEMLKTADMLDRGRYLSARSIADEIHGRHTTPEPLAQHIKVLADGSRLPASSTRTDHVAVHLPAHGLTFTATSVVDNDVPQADCEAACKACTLLGHSNWDLPTIDELQLLVDRTRYSPAINTDYFRDIENDWYWSKTPAAWSSASAWLVNFNYGRVYNSRRGYGGLALAVHRSGQ